MRGIVVIGIAEREGNQFVSLCPELDVASCGDTAEEALDMLEDALQVFIGALIEVDTLSRVFKERGVEILDDFREAENVFVSIPPHKTVRAYPLRIPEPIAV